MARNPATTVYFESFGQGAPLILGYPVSPSATSDAERAALKGYIEALSDRYRVVVLDYPNVGKTQIPPSELTADRVCKDLLSVADAAGFERFAWWGFSWGGVIGLQLASRTERVATLVCGGWPPFGGPYADLLRAARAMAATRAEYHQYVTFYESVQSWPETESVGRIRCPRLTYVGSNDEVEIGGVKIPLAALTLQHRKQLDAHSWQLSVIPDRDHGVCMDPETVVPVIRPFLDRAMGVK